MQIFENKRVPQKPKFHISLELTSDEVDRIKTELVTQPCPHAIYRVMQAIIEPIRHMDTKP